jgi:hypothetical protein
MQTTRKLTEQILPYINNFLKRKFPLNYNDRNDKDSLFENLKNNYSKFEAFDSLINYVVLPLMAFGIGQLLIRFYETTVYVDKNIVFQILPHGLWYFPATLFAITLLKFPRILIFKLILKNKYDDFIKYLNLKEGYDTQKVITFISLCFGLFSIIIAFLVYDYSIKIFDDKIVKNDFLSITGKSYKFDQINTISEVKDSKSDNIYHIVKFNNGENWDTDNSVLNDNKREPEFIKFIESKTNIKTSTAE